MEAPNETSEATKEEIPIVLGDKIADRATKVQGVLTAVCTYVGGRQAFCMTYADENGKIVDEWMDHARLQAMPGDPRRATTLPPK